MKIAITGSTGIIGRELFRQLYAKYEDADFILINRAEYNIEIPRVRSIKLNILSLNKKIAHLFFKKQKINYFFHLAWDTNHLNYLISEDNLKWESASIILIDEFYINGGLKFIGIGTSLEYNWEYPSPFYENKSLVSGNNWKYGQAKLNIFKHLFEKSNDISYLWCRVFFVFGPGQDASRLIPLLIRSALYGGTPVAVNIYSKRDYISTFEIAKQILMMFESIYSGPINIASGKALSLGEIISIIEGISGKSISLSKGEYSENFDIKEIYGSLENTKKFFPNYSYEINDLKRDIEKVMITFENKNN